MTRLIKTEFLKLRTIRLPWGLLAGAAGLTALITLLLASRAGGVAMGDTIPPLYTQAGVERIISATRFGLLFATILGNTIAAGEFRHGTATPTYLATPHRNRVMLAKLTTAAGIGALFGLVASAVATGVGLAFVAAKGYSIAVPALTMLRFAVGSALSAALFAAIGVAVGSLIRNQVAGIVGVFAWGFVFENILGGIFPTFGRWLPYTASIGMAGRPDTGMTTLPFGLAAALLTAIAVGIAAIAARASVQKDIA
jgi:hypothetical protein